MNTIETILIFLSIIIAGIALMILFFARKRKDIPDGIIAINDDGEKLKANFILCMPIEEFLGQKRVMFEVKHIKDSQKIQDT